MITTCARPWIGRWSTYTVLGLIGYVTAAITLGILGAAIGASLVERAISIVMPAVGFVIAVYGARAVLGAERIVFYQAGGAAWFAAVAAAAFAGERVALVSDFAIILIAIFLAFGRIGCFHVACCHGRPAPWGVRYTREHVALGFPSYWSSRRVFPLQLVESAASAVLAGICVTWVATRGVDGTATVIFVIAYAAVRAPLELARGDSGRPYALGLSEAQWIALITAAIATVVRPSIITVVVSCVLAAFCAVVAARNRSLVRRLRRPRHLDEIARILRSPAASETSVALKVSVHPLPNDRLDVVWSHPSLSASGARMLACDLFESFELVPGTTSGLYHVITASR
ncbi:MAG: prolipoprotein diacylglyceryl transferase family protein [Kofleriaceae bacterium]